MTFDHVRATFLYFEHYLIWKKRAQSVKGDTLFLSQNIANIGFLTSINTYFWSQRFESKNFAYIRIQTFMTTFFLADQSFKRPVIPLGGHWLLFLCNCTMRK